MSHLSIEQTTERVILDRLRVNINTYVSRNAMLETYFVDHLVDQLAMQLRSEVLAQKIDSRSAQKTVTFSHPEPSSAWQMFKRNHAESWWLGWLVARRPVRSTIVTKHETVTFTTEALAIYPDATITLPEKTFGAPYIVYRVVAQ